MAKSVISEYGVRWAANRILYNLKLKFMKVLPLTEKWYEKKTAYPRRLNIFDIDIERLKTFIQGLCDEDKAKLIYTADKACNGVITGFSSLDLDYGNPLDWQLNPLTRKRCDEKIKWFRITDFDKERGDIKAIWEASRFSHFITLARAYLLTGDRKYYEAFSSQLKSWLVKNRYAYGANFKCGQECSFRMVNTLLSYTVFRECDIATDADVSNVKDLVDRCYRKVLSNFFYAYRCIKNNHTISELMGMIVGAWCCGEQKSLDKAYSLLDKVIDEQFNDDGGYRQFSFNYQRLALQDLECVMSISDVVGRSLSNQSKDKIRKAAILMYQCQDESGDMPNYGSNDSALIFPVTSCSYRDFRPVINTIYALSTGKQLYEVDKHLEELIWFSSRKNFDGYRVQKTERVSSQFADAGLFTLRGSNSWAMIVSNDYHSRPAHMDQFHFDLWIHKVNVLCDGGTLSYASEEGRELVRNGSHNTVVIDEKPQMNEMGPFMIYGWTKRKLGLCNDSSFIGKIVSANDYEHVRKIKQTDDSYEITDKADRDYKILFHTPCEVAMFGDRVILSNDGKQLCMIRSSGKIELQNSVRSLYYLKKEVINCLSISGRAGTSIKTKIEIIDKA